MSIKTTIRINEGNSAGLKVVIRDTNSDVVVPSSMDWHLRDSIGTVVASGYPSSLSSETVITFTNSQMLVSSGEVKSELKRIIDIEARYTSTVFGANAIDKESFEFTLVNNPY